MPLDDAGQLDLHASGKVQLAGARQQIGHPALARLRIHADHGLVGAAHVFRIERKVGNVPYDRVLVAAVLGDLAGAVGEALLDGVLMGAREGRVDEVAAVGRARRDVHLRAVLDDAAHPVDVGEVELGVDSLAEEVEREGDEVDVAGPLALAEEAAFDAVDAGQHGQLGRGDARAAVVVVVRRKHDVFASREVSAHVLDLVGVHVGRAPFDRRRQVDDDLAVRPGLPHVHDRFAHFEGEVQLGVDEDFGRVLESCNDVVAQRLLHVGDELLRAGHRQLLGRLLVVVEDDAAEDGRGCVVQVDDSPRQALQGIDGLVDDLLPRLGEDGDRHVLWHEALFDQAAAKLEVCRAGGGKADLDLFQPELDEQFEHELLAGGVHRLDEGLVSVAKVGREPPRRFQDAIVRPCPVGKRDGIDVEEMPILGDRHAGWILAAGTALGFHCFSPADSARVEATGATRPATRSRPSPPRRGR